jgi:enoyl-[acyl-carrier protein] reductase II
MLRNGFAKNMLDMVQKKADPWETMKYGVGRIRKAYVEGDLEMGSLVFSQVCGLIRDIPTCQHLIASILSESEEILRSVQSKILPPGLVRSDSIP